MSCTHQHTPSIKSLAGRKGVGGRKEPVGRRKIFPRFPRGRQLEGIASGREQATKILLHLHVPVLEPRLDSAHGSLGLWVRRRQTLACPHDKRRHQRGAMMMVIVVRVLEGNTQKVPCADRALESAQEVLVALSLGEIDAVDRTSLWMLLLDPSGFGMVFIQ